MQTYLTDLQTEASEKERTWTVDEIPVLTAACSLPQPVDDRSRIARRIRRYYQAQEQAFLRYCQYTLLPAATAEYRAALAASAPLPCFHAELSYQVTWNGEGLWSVTTESRERIGNAPTLRIRRGDTWNLSTGFPLALSSLFLPKAKWKALLLQTAAEEIQRQERCGISQYDPRWPQLLRRRFRSQNFYLADDGLHFFYPMYAIAPAAEGIPTFTLPRDTPQLKAFSSAALT